MAPISLIAGLGNPGPKYAETRHNAGFWFLQHLQQTFGCMLSPEKRYQADTGSFQFENRTIRVIAPQTFMNLSGRAVAPFAAYYRIPVNEILVVHDELDLDPGMVKYKQGGGHGGHNGLRDIVSRLGSKDFNRLRIGIGRPPAGMDVSAFVLQRTPANEAHLMQSALDQVFEVLPQLLRGESAKAMNQLHTT